MEGNLEGDGDGVGIQSVTQTLHLENVVEMCVRVEHKFTGDRCKVTVSSLIHLAHRPYQREKISNA